jgi:hypothetical protein
MVRISLSLSSTKRPRKHLLITNPRQVCTFQLRVLINRRTQARFACRIGAEVYRGGTSVPNYCCLTDLSSGGCYLEVPLPFPRGAEVEIVVRTHELKLRLRGTVQASHPGFGMGVAFELKTHDEQSSVKQLLDFVENAQPNNNQ